MSPTAAIFGVSGHTLSTSEHAFLRAADPWGFILFERNLGTADQIRQLCSGLREAVGRDALVLVDQEGGRVARLRPPLAQIWPPPLEEAQAAGNRVVQRFHQRYQAIARELRSLGIDTNCAPVLDVATTETHPFLRNRCYGNSPESVTQAACAVVSGLSDGGILAVGKHFPGHGRATSDSHLELPRVTATLDTLEQQDFRPFQSLSSELSMGMTAHVVFDAIDDEPATHSAAAVSIIRNKIGFAGLLMTDDISMKALQGTVAQRTSRAITAGCDIVLHCNGCLHEMERIAAAAGPLGTQAHERAKTVLARRARIAPAAQQKRPWSRVCRQAGKKAS